jgi:Fe-S-cluster containining protein
MAMTRSERWTCISNCGACCRLAPQERPEALEALDEDQRRRYLAMVGPDGWCVHYDSGGRRCRIYEDRPEFCCVGNLPDLFGVPEAEADAFAIACCRQQIRTTYGGRGRVYRSFERAIQGR